MQKLSNEIFDNFCLDRFLPRNSRDLYSINPCGEALSVREIEVLQKIAAGKANKEISAELFIGQGTVKAHVKTIFRKLDVVSRTEAVARAIRRGLIRL